MDMFSLNTFDNTNDFAGVGGSSIAWLSKASSILPPINGGKSLTPGEQIIANAAQGKPSATITQALPTSVQNALSWANPGRVATVILGIAFLIIAAAAIAFGRAEKALTVVAPGVASAIS